MKLQKLKEETGEWVKHFNHEISTINTHLSTIAKASRHIKRIDVNQQNDYSDILYMREVLQRQENEIRQLREQFAFILLMQKVDIELKKIKRTMMEETAWQKAKG